MSKAVNQSISNISVIPKKLALKDEGNIKPDILNEIIVNKKGKPDYLAIDIYVEVRSWFKLKKTIVNGNVVYSSKLKSHGFQIGYEYFVKKHKCTDETIRTKLVLLEELGLLTREFRTEYFYGKKFNNIMYLLVWKDTPYFYSEIGLEKPKKLSSSYPENQGHLSQNSLPPIQKNLDNIYVIPNNNPIEEITSSVAREVISEHNILNIENNTRARDPIQHKHATFAPCLLTQLEQVAPITENQKKPTESVTICDGLQSSKEIPKMKQDDIVPITDEQTRKMLLSQALWKAFGEQQAGEIQDSCIFRELERDRVGIYTGDMLLNDVDKAKIRKAIRSVYGDEVQITGLILNSRVEEPKPSNENVQVDITPKSRPEKQNWLKFKSLIITNNLTSMLNNPMLKVIEIPGKVIIETVPFLIERLTAPGHIDELERVILETGLTLELSPSNPHPEYKNFHKDPIVLSPEKILKDQEFRENCKPLILSEILNELKNKEQNND